MDKKEKIKQFVETHNGKYDVPKGKLGNVGFAKFSTEKEAWAFMGELERRRVCCGPAGSDFTKVNFHENVLGAVLA